MMPRTLVVLVSVVLPLAIPLHVQASGLVSSARRLAETPVPSAAGSWHEATDASSQAGGGIQLPGEVSREWWAEARGGLEEREYQVTRAKGDVGADSWQAPNRRHNLRIYFGNQGVTICDRTAEGSPMLLRLSFKGLGREGDGVAAGAGAAETVVDGNRVELRRPEVTEWFINGPTGLEQGFEIARRPAGEGELTIELWAEGAQLRAAGGRVFVTAATGRVLEYGKLAVTDAAGFPVPGRLAVRGEDTLIIAMDDAGARYPLKVDPLLTATADALLESNQAESRLGYSVAGAGDVNGDGYVDVIVGAYRYDNGETDEGAAFVHYGGATGISSTPAVMLESNQASAYLGFSVAGAGDLNGDGYGDVIVGAPYFDNGETDEGAAFVHHGAAEGISPTPAVTLESNQGGACLGVSVAGAGDVNGDGYADVIVGADWYDGGEMNEGGAFVYHGGAAGISFTSAVTLESNQASAFLGFSVAGAGDVNGDGYADVIVGAHSFDNGETDEGAAFVHLGAAAGISSTPAVTLESNQAESYLGWSVAGAGDVNGDGYADVIVGAYNFDNGEEDEGAAFVHHGGAAGISPTPAVMLESNQTSAYFGFSVAGAGDVNGDGYADVIVGADLYDSGEMNEGAAFVYHGGAAGISATPALALESNQASAFLGFSVAGAGDVNGDGYADVIVGANLYDGGETNEGAAFVYHGGATGISATPAVMLESNQASANFGWSIAGAGDVNGDGYADVIVGAYSYDNGQTNEGAVFVHHGGAGGIVVTPAVMLESNQGSANFGCSVAGAGDVNGDGYADVIVGAYRYDNGEVDEGAAFVYHGGAEGISATPAGTLEQNLGSSSFGVSVAGAGDVNGDGYADVIVGAHAYDNGQADEGAAFVYHGGAEGISATAAVMLEANQASANFGYSVAGAGDVNGDGYGDVIVGAYVYDNGQLDEGAAFVYHGGAEGISAIPAVTLESNQEAAYLGYSVAGAGDVNGDGYADVIVGAFMYDNAQASEGAAFVHHGGSGGISATPAVMLESNQEAAYLGVSVAGAGDVNGDGYADVIVGAQEYDNGQTTEGAAFIHHGGAEGISATPAVILESNQAAARLGVSVAGAGDVNGDGYADVIVGANNYDSGQTDEGAVFVHMGNGMGVPILPSQYGSDGGTSVAPWGFSDSPGSFQVRMKATSVFGRASARLQVQYCPSGSAFGSAECGESTSDSWTEIPASGEGVTLSQTVAGLTRGGLYRWRARVLCAPHTVTAAGITAPPNPAHGPWRRLNGQSQEADVRVFRSSVADDFDGDGMSDVLLRNVNAGTFVLWFMSGKDVRLDASDPAYVSGALPYSLSAATWLVEGTGDFDGDGASDILLRNIGTGSFVLWFMKGKEVRLDGSDPAYVSGALPYSLPVTTWKVEGTGDFDGDGKADVLLRNTGTGSFVIWLMNGKTVRLPESGALPYTLSASTWRVEGTGDFDGDGLGDILLRNSGTGSFVVWFMNGKEVKLPESGALPYALPVATWRVEGVGDFDGDGMSDVLIRNNGTGSFVMWLMDGKDVRLPESGSLPYALPVSTWQVEMVGEFDGDGMCDVLVRNRRTGGFVMWLMNGTTVRLPESGALPYALPASTWQVENR